MRLRRLSFVAGWSAVALLAMAGFAVFDTPDPTVDELDTEAAAASLGHTTGAYAGLTFALLVGEPAEVSAGVDGAADLQQLQDSSDPSKQEQPSTGSMVSETSGWLSQVQVRAVVSRYFAPEDVNKAVRVAWCESRFDPNSTNLRTGAVGLFQHLPQYWTERASSAGFPGADPTDPAASTAAAAWAVYDGGGWDTFACRG
ncbi:MAG TPA: transglycosylase SLT domain-containing protein [Acidimicrobiia bacterium]|nr:transglycosylase SLT domain-containing protein [Acidimicrobiia bacterium]